MEEEYYFFKGEMYAVHFHKNYICFDLYYSDLILRMNNEDYKEFWKEMELFESEIRKEL